MDKEKKEFAVNLLRRGSYKWAARNEAKKAAKVAYGIYECAICKQHTKSKDTQMDHVVPVKDVRGVEQTLDETAERMFVNSDSWQLLCSGCHLSKTRIENACRKEIEDSVKKMHKELQKLQSSGLE